ncbi:BRISC and BRCA1-A complex member 2 [Nilaparvata lugens]|uniref:BRISC and BRCA1-A complex member 2 n=1 Tax=Nilaparvata lugens TaxID=108931 RepID=UPI000B97EC94|nr:BRISC and BRCA1-A complex member 2 [Nilaparvata lugens]
MENMICSNTQQTLQQHIKELLKHNFGISGKKATISNVRASQPGLERNEETVDCFGDRFQLCFEFANQFVYWDVVLDSSSADNPPDFDLNNDAFTNNYITVDLLEEAVPSLNNWQPNNPDALKNVVCELLQLFKKYQVDQLKELQNYINYENAMESGLVSDSEVLIDSTGFTTFLFRLPMDMSDFDVGDTEDDYAIHVSLEFSRPTAKMTKPKIKLTPALLDVMHIKQFSQKQESTCSDSVDLADFLRRVLYKANTSILHHKVKPVTKRKRFIFEFLNVRGTSVLEFDALQFLRASFLLNDDKNFLCILTITLTERFPVTAPVYTLRSIYTAQEVVILENVPFHVSWDIRVAIKRALLYIENKLDDMKNKPVHI